MLSFPSGILSLHSAQVAGTRSVCRAGHLPYPHAEMMGTLQESVGAALVLENVGLISSHGKPESKLVRKPTSMSFGRLSLEDIPSQTLLEV